ncbi:coth protein-domain-containing protein [Gongronella butleri]|nr:coth protein-domain-containing protein [Gongronella butleri]
MQPVSPGSIVYTASAAKATKNYQYVQLDKNQKVKNKEKFVRTAINDIGLHQFYGRDWTKRATPKLPRADSLPTRYNRADAKKLHPDDEIPSIQIIANQADFDRVHTYYLQEIEIQTNVTYITSKDTSSHENVRFKIGGRSTRYFTKLAYNLKLDKGDDIDGFRKIKLRGLDTTDPSYLRETLGYGLLEATGRPASRSSYARVFLNQRPIGLYLVVEQYDDNFLQNTFNAGKKKYNNGILYEGSDVNKHTNRAADLSYHGDDVAYYNQSAYDIAEAPKDDKKDNYDQLIQFTKFIDGQLKATNKSADAWKNQLDANGMLVNLALEFLQGSWDTYAQNTNNYFIYWQEEKSQFVFLSWDLDFSLGNGLVKMSKLLVGDYREYQGFLTRPLTKALLTTPEFCATFTKQLKTIVDDVFNPTVLNDFLDKWAAYLEDDVAWDAATPRVRRGPNFTPLGKKPIDNWLKQNETDNRISLPLSFSVTSAIDMFAFRFNSDISMKKAINGPIHLHPSIEPLKSWIKTKYDNVQPFLSKTTC